MNQYLITLKTKKVMQVSTDTFGQQGVMVLFFNRGEDLAPDEIKLAIHEDEIFSIELKNQKESVN